MYLGFKKAGVTKLYTKAEYSLFSHSAVTLWRSKTIKISVLAWSYRLLYKMKRPEDYLLGTPFEYMGEIFCAALRKNFANWMLFMTKDVW